MNAEKRPQEDERGLEADLRRLLRASLFFGGCVLVVVALGLVGLYH